MVVYYSDTWEDLFTNVKEHLTKILVLFASTSISINCNEINYIPFGYNTCNLSTHTSLDNELNNNTTNKKYYLQ